MSGFIEPELRKRMIEEILVRKRNEIREKYRTLIKAATSKKEKDKLRAKMCGEIKNEITKTKKELDIEDYSMDKLY